MYWIIFIVVVSIIILLVIAYNISGASQQVLSLTIPFENTYRYVPHLNRDQKFKLDSIKITLTGSIKKNSVTSGIITSGNKIKQLIEETIIQPYKNCLIVQEVNTFIAEENILKKCPLSKTPTLENLSIIFFNKLAPLMPKIGSQLISVRLESEGMKVSNSKYKIKNYSL